MPKGIWKNRIREPLTKEHRKKLSEAHVGKFTGKNHPNWSGDSIELVCQYCNKKYKVRIFRKNISKYCSKECFYKSLIGHKINQGRKRSMETRIKISANLQKIDIKEWNGFTATIGEKIKSSEIYRKWRKQVFQRDNYICQKTGVRGSILHPHHIKNFADYPELRFVVDNGITLADEVHREFHKIYGRRNNTREQLEEFLSIGLK